MKTTNKQRIAEYDAVKAERDKLELALYDLLNGRFTAPVRKYYRHYGEGETGHISVRLSWRAMPLYLVETSGGGFQLYAETELEDLFRKRAGSAYARMLMDARGELVFQVREAK
jgi:hypothetical protein